MKLPITPIALYAVNIRLSLENDILKKQIEQMRKDAASVSEAMIDKNERIFKLKKELDDLKALTNNCRVPSIPSK